MVNYGLVVGIPTPLKNDGVRQLGLLFPIYGKQHVPNHQPVLYAWLPERERGYGLGSLYIRKCFCTLCKWCVANQHLSGSIMTWPWESNGFMAMSEEICRVTTGYMYLAWSHMFYGLGVHIYMFSFRLKCAWDIHVADSPSGDCCCCPWGLPDRIRDS